MNTDVGRLADRLDNGRANQDEMSEAAAMLGALGAEVATLKHDVTRLLAANAAMLNTDVNAMCARLEGWSKADDCWTADYEDCKAGAVMLRQLRAERDELAARPQPIMLLETNLKLRDRIAELEKEVRAAIGK